MTIEALVNKAISDLRARGEQLTPDKFKKIFCRELKKAGLAHEECEKVSKYTERFNENYRKLIKSYGVKEEDELFQFMLSQINRMNPAESDAFLQSQLELISKMSKAIALLKNKEAANLAKTTLDRVVNYKSLESLASVKQKWEEFSSSYSDSFLDPLSKHCAVRKGSFEHIVDDIMTCFDKLEFSTEELALLFSEALKPSIATTMDDELRDFISKLVSTPSLIKQRRTQKEIKTLISKRIFLDNKDVKAKLVEIDKVIELFSKKLLSVTQSSQASVKKIGMVKSIIKDMNASDNTFDGVKAKLLHLVDAIDVEISEIADSSKEMAHVNNLKQKIASLEKELENVKEEAAIDQLTKVSNRKSLDEEMARLEEYYKRFGDDFSIVFFDVDYFKNVNDKFGHLAGDTVLASFALILKKYSRDIDIIGRWGGEEFVAILLKDTLEDGVLFANKIRSSVENTKFVYKESRIPVTISAGVANRKEAGSLRDMIKLSDDRLYAAKNGGRNRVEPVI